MALEHHDDQPVPSTETSARRRLMPDGVDPFREMEVLAAAANSINDQTYRYRVGVQNCGAFKEPR